MKVDQVFAPASGFFSAKEKSDDTCVHQLLLLSKPVLGYVLNPQVSCVSDVQRHRLLEGLHVAAPEPIGMMQL